MEDGRSRECIQDRRQEQNMPLERLGCLGVGPTELTLQVATGQPQEAREGGVFPD